MLFFSPLSVPLKGARFVWFPLAIFRMTKSLGVSERERHSSGDVRDSEFVGHFSAFRATLQSRDTSGVRRSVLNVVNSLPIRCLSALVPVLICSLHSGGLFSLLLLLLLLLLSGEVTPSWQIYVILWPVRGSTYDV